MQARFDWTGFLVGTAANDEGLGGDGLGDVVRAGKAGHSEEYICGAAAWAQAVSTLAKGLPALSCGSSSSRVMLRWRGMSGQRGHACLLASATSHRTSRKARSVDSNERDDKPKRGEDVPRGFPGDSTALPGE